MQIEMKVRDMAPLPVRQRKLGFLTLRHPAFGFTMVELLMALLILAEIATFTIPKVLSATQTNTRYAEAQEVLGTITELTYNYALENDGCFPGNLTCKFDQATGAIQDGKAIVSTPGQTSFNQFNAYLDNHLNYVEKGTCGTLPCWTLPNGTTYTLKLVGISQFRPSQYTIQVNGEILLDTSIAQRDANQYSYGGVDGDFADIFTYANGGAYGGINNYWFGSGWLGAFTSYTPSNASIFDLKEHPEDTCVAVGGWQCGM
jgi:type II secretory pathway pseudopilin PulG